MPRVEFTPQIAEQTKDHLAADEGVYKLKDALIQKHSSIKHLASIPILIIFSKKPSYRKGRQVLGAAKVFPQKERLWHPYWFLITLDQMFWEEYPDRREPLLFHELLHCELLDGKPQIQGHDLEEFSEVVRHYGLWSADVKSFTQQLNLLGEAQSA